MPSPIMWSFVIPLALACAPVAPEAPEALPPLPIASPQPAGPPPGPQALGASPTEDLSSSWREELAQAAPAIPPTADCPDADADGFPSAQACPGRDAAVLDCDDNDPAVTPATERWVPPGPFLMGSDSAHAGRDEQPVHVVQLAGYCLDRTEVSTGEWSAWLRAEGHEPTGADVRSLSPDGAPEPGRGPHPAEGVTWQEAVDYCATHGKSLPTEAQWEKASRGGCELGDDPNRCDPADLRAYPWGEGPPTCEWANHQLTTGPSPQLCHSDTLPVLSGERWAGPYGHLHLAGNVWEFVADAYHPGVYGEGSPRNDPAGPPSGDLHVLRGGGWNTFSTNMRAANRFHDLVKGSATGFRCARPTVTPAYDGVEPLRTVTLEGHVSRDDAALVGRALYITAFDHADIDPATGLFAPGRSPVAELMLEPNGSQRQAFSLDVPAGAVYLVSAALDAGTGAQKDGYISASGSGGFGQATQNPVHADAPVTGLEISLHHPVHPPGGPPMGPPHGP